MNGTIDLASFKKEYMITGRQAMAISINFGIWPVIDVDLDEDQESADFSRYGMCRLYHENKFHPDRSPILVKGQLVMDGGSFVIEGFGAMIKDSFTVKDFEEMVEESMHPIIIPGGDVILAVHSRSLKVAFAYLQVVSERTDIHCYDMATLHDPSEEEMHEVCEEISNVLEGF